MLLTCYGIREWGAATVAALLAAALLAWAGLWWWIIAPGVLWFAVAGFFRDPLFRTPATTDANDLVSPADGTISAIERLPSHEATNGEPALVIRIFLSVLNVHINRAPCAGRVTSITHRPGKYLDARSAESAKVNESNMLVLETASGAPIGIRQISGAIARRIVCPVSVGHDLARGERYGMIKFGSTTELIVRDIEGTAPLVKPGDTVRGGVTILTRIP
jgi:phosphatidylserine decarboxylase